MDVRPGLWPAVGVALLGHGAVLTQLKLESPAPAPEGLRASVMTVTVRPLVPQRDPQEPQPQPQVQPAVAPQLAEVTAPARMPDPVQVAKAPEAAAAPVLDPPYLPRGELTVAPKLLTHADVPFPDEVSGIVDLTVRLTLFIDERGAVQRVRLDTPDVPAPFERAVQETFGAARFAPGELDHVPVRSQVRLEVQFEAPRMASGGSRRSPS